ncbi:hypothetical protein PT974_08797 [Cladobotryum mycophilum]|uniref:Mid2 domain-containing protein n=1 Tax=Cladobotryum mycophilum TaxID=491253 RepID=A0ABR0SED0_9HYPO
MRHNRAILFALGAAVVPIAASDVATPQSGIEKSWAPPKETLGVNNGEANDQQLALGFSPMPTEAPKPLFGRMMLPRQEFSMGPATCGFVPTAENSFTCITNGATCTPQGGFVGCCQPNSACSAIKTTCINYQSSSAGACDLPSDYHTLCCASSALPACYTWVVQTSAKTDKSAQLYTLFDCSPSAGRGTLLTRDPAWPAPSTTASPTVVTTSTPGPTSTSPVPPPPVKKKSGTPVGAIAGGAVGGVAVLGLIGVAAFFFLRKKPQPDPKPADNSPPPPSMAHPTSPTSPSGTGYTSGAPSNYQYAPISPQQNYDPNMAAAYNNGGMYQGQYNNHQQFNNQVPYQGHYAPQAYGYPTPTASTSPPPVSPSPGIIKEGGTPPAHEHQHHQPAQELPAVNPIGAETNRAELPSS